MPRGCCAPLNAGYGTVAGSEAVAAAESEAGSDGTVDAELLEDAEPLADPEPPAGAEPLADPDELPPPSSTSLILDSTAVRLCRPPQHDRRPNCCAAAARAGTRGD